MNTSTSQSPSFTSNKSFTSSAPNSSISSKANKYVVVILNNENRKTSQQQHQANHVANLTVKPINKSENRDSPASPEPLPESPLSNELKGSGGVVKNLRKKFSYDTTHFLSPTYNLTNNLSTGRNRASTNIEGFQLKKCQSVIFNLESNTSSSSLGKLVANTSPNMGESAHLKKALFYNDINELNHSQARLNESNSFKTESKDQLNELSVFEKVDIKEKINRFSANIIATNDLSHSKKAASLRHHSNDTMKYGGSCNNLTINNSVLSSSSTCSPRPNSNNTNTSIKKVNNVKKSIVINTSGSCGSSSSSSSTSSTISSTIPTSDTDESVYDESSIDENKVRQIGRAHV